MWSAKAWAVLAAACLLVPALAVAQDLGTSRRVQGTAEVTTVEVGDVPGHIVGVVEFKGLTFFADGEIATHTNPATFDLTNGAGRIRATSYTTSTTARPASSAIRARPG